jgi:hypothetical protein
MTYKFLPPLRICRNLVMLICRNLSIKCRNLVGIGGVRIEYIGMVYKEAPIVEYADPPTTPRFLHNSECRFLHILRGGEIL